MKRWLARSILCASLLAAPAAAHAITGFGFGMQAGWGSVEAELQVPGGYFLDVGIPWFVAAIDATTSGMRPSVPFGAKVGAQWEIGPLAIRTGPRVIHAPRRGDPCACGEDVDLTRTMAFADVGARLELPMGLVFGADAALFGMDKERGSDTEFLGPVGALPFSQVYVGWFVSL
ncbi:MAG TPA: hypothetical protein VN033_14505 [Vulgatibacter sp.]|nr:hypothetical protein [Vulgatibacter sp.]